MSVTVDLLLARKGKLEDELAQISRELEEVALALSAIRQASTPTLTASTELATPARSGSADPAPQHPMTVDDAIFIAVQEGRRYPKDILDYLGAKLGVNTTINSVRTRVSKLKNAGRLDHDLEGWKLPEHDERQAKLDIAA